MRPHRRTVLATVLISAAVLLPTLAWYVAGTREADRRGATLEEDALADFTATLSGQADRLARRLEELRASEGNRPFYHYQNLYHDPRGAAEGLAVTPSPLAAVAPDPLIFAHFQVDNCGRVTLPAVSERFPELNPEQGLALYCNFLAELQDGIPVTLDEVAAGDETDARTEPDDVERVLVLARSAWEQNRLAEAVYATLTQGTAALPLPGRGGQVLVTVGPLRWHTMLVGRGPVLAALRRVATPTGGLVQGFAVAAEAVAEWLGAEVPGLRLTAEPTLASPRVAIPVAATGWSLEADSGPALRVARTEAGERLRQFRRGFSAAALAAALAGVAAVFLVVHSDRLARQRSHFAAAAAHELRTPLSSLRLYGEMLADGLGDPVRSHQYAVRLAAEVERLGRVVSNMLDLARLERGGLLVHPVRGDLGACVGECVGRLRPGLEDAGMEVTMEVAPGLPPVLFDPDSVCQILHNLLDNAEKYSRSCATRRVTVGVAVERGLPAVAVTDSGPGIPHRLRRRLFRPFARPGPANRPPGLGLGLALARTLARAQGGELELAPSEVGTRVVLRLRSV